MTNKSDVLPCLAICPSKSPRHFIWGAYPILGPVPIWEGAGVWDLPVNMSQLILPVLKNSSPAFAAAAANR